MFKHSFGFNKILSFRPFISVRLLLVVCSVVPPITLIIPPIPPITLIIPPTSPITPIPPITPITLIIYFLI